MKELFLLRGLPGSGKSTLAQSLGGLHIEADQYFMDDNVYKFDASKITIAHEWCQSKVKAWMSNDSSHNHNTQVNTDRIIVSNTFTQEWEMMPYFDLAHTYHYRVYCLIVENRHGGQNTHNVPQSTLDNMKNRFDVKL